MNAIVRLEKHRGRPWLFDIRRQRKTADRVIYLTVWLWALNIEGEIGWWPT